MSFGGTPNCAVCGKAVYHMEQVIGPGRKIYHKACLKCQQCGKRLDQGSVVEHDLSPYCTRCHTQTFGTRDLRHGNVHNPSSSPLNTPRVKSPPSPPMPASPRPLPRPPTAITEFYTPPRMDAQRSIPNDTPVSTPDANTPITRPDFRSSRPISVPFAGGTKALDERGLLRRAESPRSKVGEKIMGEEACEGCRKRVYAAEQVNAIGAKWHRWCLKCATCKNTVDASKVSDKDGQVYCKNCYAKNFGPGGILGKR